MNNRTGGQSATWKTITDGVNTMSADFAFSDLGRVHWGSTLKLTLARGFCSGIVWVILTNLGPTGPSMPEALYMPFAWALIALPMALFLQLAGMFFGAIIPLMGLWFHFIGSLMICIGDPLVYLLNRSFPALLDVADLSFFNFRPMIFITYPD